MEHKPPQLQLPITMRQQLAFQEGQQLTRMEFPNATLTATLSQAAPTDVVVTLTYTGTASGSDYTASSTTITILAGQTTGTVTIDPTSDFLSENNETVIADITNVTGGNGATENGTQTATVTITDNDAPTVSLSGTTTVDEDGVTNATLTATLSQAAPTDVVVTLAYTGTASGSDYTASSTTITLLVGQTTGTVTIDPASDFLSENNETVIADITNVTGGNGATENGTQTATVTITDNDAPTVSLSGGTTIDEDGVPNATLTATLSQAAPTDVVVTLTYTGTASGSDYTASSTTITILAGQTTGTVTIDPTSDLLSENNETVIADITNVTGGNGATENGTQTATVTITDNDAVQANPDVVSTPEDTEVVVNVLGNDTNVPTNGILSIVQPTNGNVIVTDPNGTPNNPSDDVVTYTPNPGYNGLDTFTYTICDNATPIRNCSTAVVNVNISQVNDSPIVDNDVNTTNENTSTVGGDLTDAGDFDPDGTSLVVTTTPVSGPSNGTIVINPDGTYVYTPNPNFDGTDIITVQVCDTGSPLPGICVNQTLTITVKAVNLIVAIDDTPNPINGGIGGIVPTVLSNDTLNGVVISPSDVVITASTLPSGFILNSDGSIEIKAGTPAANYTINYGICTKNPPGCL